MMLMKIHCTIESEGLIGVSDVVVKKKMAKLEANDCYMINKHQFLVKTKAKKYQFSVEKYCDYMMICFVFFNTYGKLYQIIDYTSNKRNT